MPTCPTGGRWPWERHIRAHSIGSGGACWTHIRIQRHPCDGMIGFFPTPYPNELVYSLCARFADRMRFPTITGTMEALFGRRHAVAIVDLPHGLEVLVNSLPCGHSATVDGLINSH